MSFYFFLVSTCGCFLLFVLSIGAFANQEALRLKPGTSLGIGFKLLLCSIVNIIWIIIIKRYILVIWSLFSLFYIQTKWEANKRRYGNAFAVSN